MRSVELTLILYGVYGWLLEVRMGGNCFGIPQGQQQALGGEGDYSSCGTWEVSVSWSLLALLQNLLMNPLESRSYDGWVVYGSASTTLLLC